MKDPITQVDDVKCFWQVAFSDVSHKGRQALSHHMNVKFNYEMCLALHALGNCSNFLSWNLTL